MLYESDINQLLSQWEAGLSRHSPDYKVAVRDCIYDLKCLIERNFSDEIMANEAFEQQVREGKWEEFFDSLTKDGLFA